MALLNKDETTSHRDETSDETMSLDDNVLVVSFLYFTRHAPSLTSSSARYSTLVYLDGDHLALL